MSCVHTSIQHQSSSLGTSYISCKRFSFLLSRNCVLLWPVSACCVVVLPWSVTLLENQISFSCQNIWNWTSYKVCPYHNGNCSTCTTSPASDCDLHYWGSKWFWTDQISTNPVYWVAKGFHILLPGPAHQHSRSYWNSPAHHNILDHSQGNGCAHPNGTYYSSKMKMECDKTYLMSSSNVKL